MTNTATLLIAVNDAKLDVTSRNRDDVLARLIRTAQDNGRPDVARTLGRIAVDHRADVETELRALARTLRDEARA